MTKVWWETYLGGDGIFTLEKELLYSGREPENLNTYSFHVKAGFMEGSFRVSREDLLRLRSFLNKNLQANKKERVKTPLVY
jgi:hypothetical protein